MMRVESIPFERMTGDLRHRWEELQRSNPALSSPYFRPEFFEALRDIGRPCEVGVIERAGKVVGFLPFERRRFGLGRPAGWPMSDYQGAVADPAWQPDLARLAAALRLRALDFDHLVAGQAMEHVTDWRPGESLVMELADGFESYCEERRAGGSRLLRENDRKLRKAAREVGEPRFVFQVGGGRTSHLLPRRDVLLRLLAWKSEQYAGTGLLDLFAFQWPVRLLERLLEEHCSAEPAGEATGGFAANPAHGTPVRGVNDGSRLIPAAPDFDCILSALYIGDRLAAAHLGLRCRGTLHSWFPAYDDRLSKYSPGTILLLELARAASERGILRIDLGKGDENYKRRFANSAVPLAEGSIVRSPLVRAMRQGWGRTRQWVRASAARPVLEVPVTWVRQARKSLALK